MQPKILVGTPTSFHKEYCLTSYLSFIRSLTYSNFKHLIVENSGHDEYFKKLKSLNLDVIKGPFFESPIQSISSSRNILIKRALRERYDYLLFLDQDVLLPGNALQRLISHNKKAICGVYFNHITQPNGLAKLSSGVYKLILGTKDKLGLPSMEEISQKELWGNKLLRVVSCGGGCLLLHKDILKQVKFREDLKRCEDRWFCVDLFKKNIELFCDPTVKCKHLIQNRRYVWRRGYLVRK